MWLPGSVFNTSNVTGEILRRAQSNNCTTNEDINPAFPSDQQSCQPEILVMPSAFTLPSNVHSRHTLSHLGPSFATHPASIERLPWEYPSQFSAQHQTMPCAVSGMPTNNWHASIPHSLPSPITPLTCPPRPLSEGTALYSAVPLLSSPSKEYLSQ